MLKSAGINYTTAYDMAKQLISGNTEVPVLGNGFLLMKYVKTEL